MSCGHDIHAVDDVTLDIPMASLSCASCLRRISPWAGWACPRSADPPDDKTRLKTSVGGETCEDRRCEVGAEHENSENDGRSLFFLSDAEDFGKISMPVEVPAELVAENLKLQAELKRQRRQEGAPSFSLIGEVDDEDEKEVQQQKLKEAAASNAYTKPVFHFGGEIFSGRAPSVSDIGSQLRDSSGTCRNFVSHSTSIASRGRGRRGVVSAASACAATTAREALTPTARICSESSSSPCASAAASSETVSEIIIFKQNFLLSVAAHDDAKRMTGSLPFVSNSGATSNLSLRQQQQQLGCDAEHGGDTPSSRLATISSAHSLLSPRVKSAPMGNGRSSRPRSPDACTPERESCHVVHSLDGRSLSRQRSRSPDISRRSVTAPRIGGRGRSVFRGRRFGSPRSPVATTCYTPASQAGRRRDSRGSTGRPSRSRSPVASIPSMTASRIGSRGRGGSRRRGGSRTRGSLRGSRGRGGSRRRGGSRTRGGLPVGRGREGSRRRGGSRTREGLPGSRFGTLQSPDARASGEPAFRAGRPKGRKGSRLQSSMSRSPDATIPSSTASCLCHSSKRGRRGCSRRPLSPDGSRLLVHASFIRGRRGKRGKRGCSSMPQSPDARRPSGSESHIDNQDTETSAAVLRRRWSRSRSYYVSRSSTPARMQGCCGRRGASPLSPRLSASALLSSSAAVRPDLTVDTELTAPAVCNDLTPDEDARAAAAAGDAVSSVAAPPLSPGCSQLPQSDAEIAHRLQSLYNLEHKYKLNGLRVTESDGEYGLRSRSGRKDRRTGFSKVAGRAADSFCGCCRQSDDRPMSP